MDGMMNGQKDGKPNTTSMSLPFFLEKEGPDINAQINKCNPYLADIYFPENVFCFLRPLYIFICTSE